LPRSDRSALKHDLTARLLLSPDAPCEDMRRRYPDVSARTFSQYLSDSRAAVIAPVTPPATDGAAVIDVLAIPAEPPAVRGRLCIERVVGVYFEVWADVGWMRRKAMRSDGTIANPAWCSANTAAGPQVLGFYLDQRFDELRGREAKLQRFLAAADAGSAEIGELCRYWVQDYDAELWTAPRYAVLLGKLEEALQDSQLTRPKELGGGGRRCAPAQVLKSIKFRLRWMRSALKTIKIFWGEGRPVGFWMSLADWVLTLDVERQKAVMTAIYAAEHPETDGSKGPTT